MLGVLPEFDCAVNFDIDQPIISSWHIALKPNTTRGMNLRPTYEKQAETQKNAQPSHGNLLVWSEQHKRQLDHLTSDWLSRHLIPQVVALDVAHAITLS